MSEPEPNPKQLEYFLPHSEYKAGNERLGIPAKFLQDRPPNRAVDRLVEYHR